MISRVLVSVVVPVFEDGRRARVAVEHLLRQSLPADVDMEIVVVDDGSRTDSAACVKRLPDDRVRLLELAVNEGRSAARNRGAEAANGSLLVFLDGDCLPRGDGFLAAHVAALRRGHVASTGPVVGVGEGFWHRYQAEASLRRRRQHRRGEKFAGSSQNLAVEKSAFGTAGGFALAFRHYGFEDRDLLLRLLRQGDVAWTDDAAVMHTDALALTDVCAKMAEAGRHSAALFARRHPDAYRSLGYAALDARSRPWLRPVAALTRPWLPAAAKFTEPWLERLPYAAARALARSFGAASFLCGTARPPSDP